MTPLGEGTALGLVAMHVDYPTARTVTEGDALEPGRNRLINGTENISEPDGSITGPLKCEDYRFGYARNYLRAYSPSR